MSHSVRCRPVVLGIFLPALWRKIDVRCTIVKVYARLSTARSQEDTAVVTIQDVMSEESKPRGPA